jgi:hypothetical protein
MTLDVMTERGYYVQLDKELLQTPLKIDPNTLQILFKTVRVYHFLIQFKKPIIRS